MNETKNPKCPTCADHHEPTLASCDRYEGWANVETWAAALAIDNDAPVLASFVSFAETALANKRTLEFHRIVRVHVETLADIDGSQSTSMRSTLARAAMGRINFRELAEHYLTKAREGAS